MILNSEDFSIIYSFGVRGVGEGVRLIVKWERGE